MRDRDILVEFIRGPLNHERKNIVQPVPQEFKVPLILDEPVYVAESESWHPGHTAVAVYDVVQFDEFRANAIFRGIKVECYK